MFLVSTVISVIFFITKFIEMRFIDKETKPLKYLIRDSFLVYFSVIISNFIMDQINPIMDGGGIGPNLKITPAFTDNPGF